MKLAGAAWEIMDDSIGKESQSVAEITAMELLLIGVKSLERLQKSQTAADLWEILYLYLPPPIRQD